MFRLFGSFLVLCWAFPSLVFAVTSDDLRARGIVRIGMSGDYAPFAVCSDANETCTGFEVDVARRLAADLGVRLEIVRFQWSNLRQALEAEQFDVAMSGVTMRPERLLFADFTRPYAVAEAVVLVGDKKRFPSITSVDQADVRLAVNAGGHLEQVARARFGQVAIHAIPKNMELPTLVAKKQVEALLTDSFEAPQFLMRHPLLKALPSFGRDRKAYMVRRTDGELREWIDKWLIERERDGFLVGLRQQWLGETKTRSLSPFASLFALLDLRLALMPAIADYKHRYALPIEDLKQEAVIIEQAAAVARARHGDPEAVQTLFRIQIALAKQVQHFTLNKPEKIPKWARGFSLASDLRPILSSLGERIIDTFAVLPRQPLNREAMIRLTREEIVTEGVSDDGKRQLGEVIWQAMKGRKR